MSHLRLSVIIFLFIAGTVFAQEATPEVTEIPQDEIEFFAFTIPEIDVSGIAPDGWEQIQVGSYVRNQGGENTTYLLHIASNEISLEDVLAPILVAFEQEELPEDSASYETNRYDWTVYTFEYSPFPDSDDRLVVDIATAATPNLSLVLVFQTTPDEYDALHESVFLTSLDYFGEDLTTIQEGLGYGDFVPTEIEFFGIDTVIPRDWMNVNTGSYTRGDLQVDPTTLIIQTSSDLSEEEFRDLFLEQLQISVSGDGESYSSDYLNWTIFDVNIDIDGTLLTWQIATASDNDYAYLVVLFSFTDENEELRESVLIPVLDATHASQ